MISGLQPHSGRSWVSAGSIWAVLLHEGECGKGQTLSLALAAPLVLSAPLS